MRNFTTGSGLFCAAIFASLSMGELATAQVIQVAQESAPGAGDFDQNVLGSVLPIESPRDVVGFYSYGVPHTASFNGPMPEVVDQVSNIFVLLSTATNERSLVVVHDRPQDGTGGSARMHVEIYGDPNGAGFVVWDDPGETYVGSPGTSIFSTSHNWSACCTDGFALGHLDGQWEVLAEFTAPPTGISDWRVCSGTGADVPLVLQPGRRIRLMQLQCAPAFWLHYGQGWPGTLGVPSVVLSENPILGAPIHFLVENSAGAPTFGLMPAGFLPAATPTPFGGTLFVQPLFTIGVLLPVGGGQVPFLVPHHPAFCGVTVFLQALEIDAGASHGISFSEGVEVHLGT